MLFQPAILDVERLWVFEGHISHNIALERIRSCVMSEVKPASGPVVRKNGWSLDMSAEQR
jgi:hypothetical protein